MMDDLEKQDWPVDPDDISLLEKEIQQAQTFLLQSKDLRQKSEEVKSRADDVVRGHSGATTSCKNVETLPR